MKPNDLFGKITIAVLDLQAATFQTYEEPIRRLSRLLKHDDLLLVNRLLTKGVDLDAFIAASEATGGSMVGSERLLWPDDAKQMLALRLLLVQRFGDDPNFMANFGHTFCYTGRKIIDDIHAVTAQIILPFVRDYKSHVEYHGSTEPRLIKAQSNKVFIVHGRDEGARETVARYVEKLGLEPIILHEKANQGRTIIEKIEAYGDVGFAVVLLTPDDEGNLKGELPEPRARQNVLLELGYFFARLGRSRVCTLMKGELTMPSDFAGVVWEKMDGANGWKLALLRELMAAGYSIDANRIV